MFTELLHSREEGAEVFLSHGRKGEREVDDLKEQKEGTAGCV